MCRTFDKMRWGGSARGSARFLCAAGQSGGSDPIFSSPHCARRVGRSVRPESEHKYINFRLRDPSRHENGPGARWDRLRPLSSPLSESVAQRVNPREPNRRLRERLKNTVCPHLPARVWPVGAGACEVYGSDRLHPSTVQGCVMVVRHARRQFRGQSSLRVSPVQQSCWQPTEQQSAEGAKPACCIAPLPCVACPPAFLAPVGRLRSRAHAGKRCSAHYRANTVPSPLPVCIQAPGAR